MSEAPNLDEQLDPQEREVAAALSKRRPVPTAGFRGALGRHLFARDPGYGPRPKNLRLAVGGFVASGLLAVALGALIALGHV